MKSQFQFVGDFARMRAKYTAKWGSQIAEMVFQTRSSKSKIQECLSKLAAWRISCLLPENNLKFT